MRPRPWSFAAPEPELERALGQELGIGPIAARVLVQRGVRSAAQARDFLGDDSLAPASSFPDMDRAVERVLRAVAEKRRIVVFGDYDVDGLSGSALLVRLLRLLDGVVDWKVPDRLREGYGLSAQGVAWLLADPPDLVITVDHGISAREAIAELRAHGIDVVVTDHHQMPPELPDATAILHPVLAPDAPTLRWLSGSGVAFKFACGIFETLPSERRRLTRMRECLRDAIALASLGTVADVVPLRDENRVIVRKGLARLGSTDFPPLVALREMLTSKNREPDPEDVSFRIAPLLNAASRMGEVDLARRLLLSDSPAETRALARELDRLNLARRSQEQEVFDAALEAVHSRHRDDSVLVLADSRFHPGVMGIVASRLVERFGRPTLLVHADGGKGKGSGRSVAGFDLAAALRGASPLLLSHGGHAAAAGLEMELEQIDALREHLVRTWDAEEEGRIEPALEVDAEVLLSQVDGRLVDDLAKLGPFGEGNPRPTLAARSVQMAAAPRRVGQDGAHLLLKLRAPGAPISAIAFRQGPRIDEAEGEDLALAFVPRRPTFGGGAGVELQVVDLRSTRTREARA